MVEYADARQEAMLHILQLWSPGIYEQSVAARKDPTVPFEAWLHTTALGRTRDSFKQEYRHRKTRVVVIPMHRMHPSDPGPNLRGERPLAAEPTDDDPVERADEAEAVRHAVARLPGKQRFVVSAIYLESRTQAEVAAELGVSQPAVSRILSRGLAALKEKLETP